MKHGISSESNVVFNRDQDNNKAPVERVGIRNRPEFHDIGDKFTTELMIYKDKDGLPVSYDAATHKGNKPITPDDLSVLWHEILSPLTVIKGYTCTLLEFNDSITEKQKEEYLRGIESASNRMLTVLENMKGVSCLENSETWIFHSVCLSDILRRIVPEIQGQTTKHTLKIDPGENLPLVKAEPGKIEQVITNLLTNSIKYSPEGSEITVVVRLVRDERDKTRFFSDAPVISLPCLVVSVTDEGVGIPEKELKNIFQRFYRVNNRITKSVPGAGLGLYICKVIVEAHNGCIWATNRPQRGCVFGFSLPL